MFSARKGGIGKMWAAAMLVLLIQLTRLPAPAQDHSSPQAPAGEYTISINAGLVVLPVFVTDRKGSAVPGLREDSFRVFEDGRPQQIALFEAEDVPVTAGLVLDNSGSMRAKRREVLAAAEGFVTSSNPQDQMFVVSFNQTVSMGLGRGEAFTSNVQELLSAVSRAPARGKTALYDGVAAALRHLRAGTASRKTLIVISDGGDNASRLRFRQLLHQAESSNAQIYTLGLIDENFAGDNTRGLSKLAKVTGGQAYFPTSTAAIPGICREIARNLRQQYTLGYHPSGSSLGGKYHAIRVNATAAGGDKLHVSTRSGYLMPGETPSPTRAEAKL